MAMTVSAPAPAVAPRRPPSPPRALPGLYAPHRLHLHRERGARAAGRAHRRVPGQRRRVGVAGGRGDRRRAAHAGGAHRLRGRLRLLAGRQHAGHGRLRGRRAAVEPAHGRVPAVAGGALAGHRVAVVAPHCQRAGRRQRRRHRLDVAACHGHLHAGVRRPRGVGVLRRLLRDGQGPRWPQPRGRACRITLSVARSPSPQLLITGSADGTVRAWNPKTGQVHHVFQG